MEKARERVGKRERVWKKRNERRNFFLYEERGREDSARLGQVFFFLQTK